MEVSVAILSEDAVFARLLEIECRFFTREIFCGKELPQDLRSTVLLLDLDGDVRPRANVASTVIGFTRDSHFSTEGEARRCSLVLHRPFSMALFRRELQQLLGSMPESREGKLPPPKLFFSEDGSTLVCGEGRISLSPTEACLLSCLLERKGQVIPREELSSRIGTTATNKTEVYVCFLRRKLQTAGVPYRIATVRGVGYRFEDN